MAIAKELNAEATPWKFSDETFPPVQISATQLFRNQVQLNARNNRYHPTTLVSFGRLLKRTQTQLDLITCCGETCILENKTFVKIDIHFIYGTAVEEEEGWLCPHCENRKLILPWSTNKLEGIIKALGRMQDASFVVYQQIETPLGSLEDVRNKIKQYGFVCAEEDTTVINNILKIHFDSGDAAQKLQSQAFKQNFWKNYRLYGVSGEYLLPADIRLFNQLRLKNGLPRVPQAMFSSYQKRVDALATLYGDMQVY